MSESMDTESGLSKSVAWTPIGTVPVCSGAGIGYTDQVWVIERSSQGDLRRQKLNMDDITVFEGGSDE